MRHVTRGQGTPWGIGILCLLVLCGGTNHRVLATPLVASGNHARENHAGEDHTGENLGFITLTGANLAGANFSNAYLQDANFTNANLSGTNFTNANLEDGLLRGAVLTPETTFRGAKLEGADLSNLDLRASDISSAEYLLFTRFKHSNLSGLNLSGFDELVLDEATVSKADLRFSFINSARNANLTGADLRHARADENDFSNANFTNADLRFFSFDHSDVSNANFTNADLRFAELEGDFAGAVFTGANIYGTTFSAYRHLDLTGAISDPHPHATPEPSTWVLLGTGLVSLLGYGWQRRERRTI